MVKEVYFFTEMGYTAYPQDEARRRGYNNLMFPNEHFSPERAQQLYGMYFDELQYASETGFDGVMINEHHNNPLSMMPSVNVIGAVLASDNRKGRIVFLGNVLPIHDNPLRVAEEVAMIDILSGRAGGLRLRARPRPGEHRHQRQSHLQPRALRRGPRRHRQGVDDARALPLGGPALRVPRRQSVDEAAAEAASADLDPRRGQPGVGEVGGRAPVPVRGARPAALHVIDEIYDLYDEVAAEVGYATDAGASRLRHPGERGRHRREGVRGGPALLLAAGDHRSASRRATGCSPRGTSAGRPRQSRREQARAGINQRHARRPQPSATRRPTRRYQIVSGTPDTVIKKLQHIIDVVDPAYMIFWGREGLMSHDVAVRGIDLMTRTSSPPSRHTGPIAREGVKE